ncbi:MAG: sulfite exporter TauE/SafE family protein [Planctomycetales bacterium]|nr:sulfite exporter TauE/SafE family protein [Planctomycetales bacterium]
MPPWLMYVLLAAAGFGAGVVNTIAGGGSFLTLPALHFVGGLPWALANGTNRLALLLSTSSATATFARHGKLDPRLTARVALPILPMTFVGAWLAVTLPKDAFETAFGALFLAMAALLIRKPKLLLDGNRKPFQSRWAETALFAAIGLYVGFIQAGFGLLLLIAMGVFHPRELVDLNAVKTFVGSLVTVAGLSVYAYHREVEWLPGLAMATGNLLGGIVGARMALKEGKQLIFNVMIVVMVATGLKLVWPAVSRLLEPVFG